MAVLKFDEVPFVQVKAGVQRKLIMTSESRRYVCNTFR